MKIEDPRTPQGAPLAETQADVVRRDRDHRIQSRQDDGVRLSGEARLAQEATRQLSAAGVGEVRPDAVARGRALLESGQLGADTEILADAMLEALID